MYLLISGDREGTERTREGEGVLYVTACVELKKNHLRWLVLLPVWVLDSNSSLSASGLTCSDTLLALTDLFCFVLFFEPWFLCVALTILELVL